MKIAVIGVGFVGESILKNLHFKKTDNIVLVAYDKYKKNYSDEIKDYFKSLNDCLDSDIAFLSLPTKYNNEKKNYENDAIIEVCHFLSNNNFKGIVLIKSTIEPTTTYNLEKMFTNLQFIHNPEFLRAKYAFEDFKEQKYGIILGIGKNTSNDSYYIVEEMYKKLWFGVPIYKSSCIESEILKILSNSFYSIQIQFLTEIYLYTLKLKDNGNDIDYNNIRHLLNTTGLSNVDVSSIPGPDGQISYGGLCHPKDTNALLQSMIKYDTPHNLLQSCIDERNSMRNDNDNVI
jgi:UDP-glucose 6-dehydrogenase